MGQTFLICTLIADTDVVAIDRDTTQVEVFVKRTVQTVTVQFMDGRKQVGDPVRVKLPVNYRLVEKDEYEIKDGVLKLPVKYQKPADPSSPKTGDEFPMTGLVLLAVSSAATALLMLRKRREA